MSDPSRRSAPPVETNFRLPWTSNDEDYAGIVFDAQGDQIVNARTNKTFKRGGQPEQEAIAAFIVTACNAHADLAAALQALLDEWSIDLWYADDATPEKRARIDGMLAQALTVLQGLKGDQ